MSPLRLLLMWLLVFAPLGAEGTPLFRAYGAAEGIEAGRIQLVTQDRAGFLWAGGQRGVFRGDGHQFIQVKVPLEDQAPLYLQPAREKGIWIATTSGLVLWEDGQVRVRVNAGAGDRLHALTLGADGAAHVLVANQMLTVRGNQIERRTDLPGVNPQWVSASPVGDELVVLLEDGLWRHTALGWGRLPLPKGSDLGKFQFGHDGSGRLWACARNTIARLDEEGWSLFPLYGEAATFRLIPRDSQGDLWAMGPEGPLRLRGLEPPQPLDLPPGVTAGNLFTSFRDRAGILWLAGDRLYRQRGLEWTAAQSPADKGIQDVWCFHRDADARLWVGTSRGLAVVEGAMLRLVHAVGRIRALEGLPDGSALALGEGGLFRLDARSGQLVAEPPRRTPRSLKVQGWQVALLDADGLWLRNGPGSRWEPLPGPPVSATTGLRRILDFKPGWLVLQAGNLIWVNQGAGWRTLAQGLTGYSLVRDAQGTCWVVQYKDPKIHRFVPEREGWREAEGVVLPGITASEVLYTLRLDGQGRLWTLTTAGVYRTTFTARGMEHRHWTVLDGLPNDDCNQGALWISPEGQVLVGSYGALAFHDSARGEPQGAIPVPRVVAYRVKAGALNLVEDAELVLGPRPGALELRVAALLPANQERLQYEYRIQGFQDRWTALAQPSLALGGMGPGRWTLELRARDLDGAISPTGRWSLNIRAAWWETLSARIAFLLAGVGAIWLGIRLQFQRSDRRARELEALVAQRTQALGEANEALRLAKAHAEDANLAKSTFLANMSHELRTPLNAILLYSDLLVEEMSGSDPQVAQDAGKIRTAGKHLLGLIDSILDLSKIEAGRLVPVLEWVPVPDVIGALEVALRPVVERKGNALKVQCPELPHRLCTDATMLRQILTNLLGNAAKFTEQGEVSLVVEVLEGDLRFTVRDTGIGMTPAQLDRIFQPFVQAEEHTARRYGGTGLGLTISRRLVELLGGTLQVASTPGEGSRFTLTLPYAPETEVGRRAVEGGRILVIEDDEAMRTVLRHRLERDGFVVLEASSGEDGLALARSERPDLITLDIYMPVMDGYQVLQALKADPDLAGIPVVMLTMSLERERGYAMGAYEVLSKPVDPRTLTAVLRRHQHARSGATKVLLVEDDDVTRGVLGRIVEGAGWHCLEAPEAYTGLALAVGQKPDLILLDLMMPQMDGFEFLAELAQQPELRDIPVVVLTALALDEEARRRLQAPQVRAVLRKGGYSREELLAQIRVYARSVSEGDSGAS